MDAARFGGMSREWDLNNWKWDGELCLATPRDAPPPELCLSSEKRRRIVVDGEDGPPCDAAGSLSLKVGGDGQVSLPDWEGRTGAKRGRLNGGSSNSVSCQVEGCGADLSDAKDYHRRHKVCEMHAKSNRAMVGNSLQRFCQQCSRFHLLQEFDEGKRSCRRRLAGHNRRRRKTHPETNVNGLPLTDDQSNSYILITLLKILSNLHSGGSDQLKGEDLLSHFSRNITNIAGSIDANILSRLLQASQDTQRPGNSAGTTSEAPNPFLSKMTCITGTQGPSMRPIDNSVSIAVTRASGRNPVEDSLGETVQAIPSQRSVPEKDALTGGAEAIPVRRARLIDFDLNDTYNDEQDFIEGSAMPVALGTGSPYCPSWVVQESLQSSPPQTSGNSDPASALSLSNSNGDAQSRTDRIVFKLFGKEPNDLPLSLRGQVLDWLSRSPTEMETYIRPGCVILTVYLRLAESGWEELSRDLASSLNRLLLTPGDDFWGMGWIYASIQHHIAFIHNGQVVLHSPLLIKSPDCCNILSITPVAASLSARVNFKVKGFNLARPSVRLLCAFEGRYIVPETAQPLVEETGKEYDDGPQCCSFYCSVPNAIGRGFIEVEDNGLNSGFFPFVVAEQDVCSEIRMLETAIEGGESWDGILEENPDAMYARNQAIDFLHEMGWLLRRSHLRSRFDSRPDVFHLARFRWLVSFAMDREWRAVFKKLLDILFEDGVELGSCSSPAELALSEDLLHRAVRKNSKSMVQLLLGYSTPHTAAKETATSPDRFLFKPNASGSTNLTPLHIAASIEGAEGVLDALTSDPGQLGIKAWSTARDVTGFTPEDYARARGFEPYIKLVQNKIKKLEKNHVVLNVPDSLSAVGKLSGFQVDKSKLKSMDQTSCRHCDQRLMRRGLGRRSLLYRPVMLSMVGIAAVCVCVGLLLKSPPEVLFVKVPFRWETLDYGWM